MQCECITSDPMAYFMAGQRVQVRCDREAKWTVSVNPPTPERTGKVHLCDLCNEWEYRTFSRKPIDQPA